MIYNKTTADRADKATENWPDWKREAAGLPPKLWKKCNVVECDNLIKTGNFCSICLEARKNFKREEGMNEEKMLGVTDNYDDWLDGIQSYLDDLDGRGIVAITIPFKDCEYYMTKPVGMLDNKVLTAKSWRIESEDEVANLIRDNKNVVPYIYYDAGHFKIFRYGEIDA